MRQADAAQALAVWPVLRLHRLSRLQEYEGPAPAEGRHPDRAAAAVRELRQGDGAEVRPLRSVLLLLRLSRLQNDPQDRRRQGHASEADRCEMSELQRGRAGRAPFAPRHLLLLLALSEVRLRAEQSSRPAALPEVRGAVSPRKGNEARRTH